MKKKILSAVLTLGMILPNMSLVSAQNIDVKETSLDNVYVYNASLKMNEYTEVSISKPTYIIYPNEAVDLQKADELLDKMGIKDHLDDYATSAYIVNPGEDGYTQEENDDYLNIVDTCVGASMNTKVIGIGNGADFVNQYITQKDWMLAGIMLYGGTQKAITPKYSVPVYISNGVENSEEPYITVNKTDKTNSIGNITEYYNSANKFEKVVVNFEDETVDKAFDNAWKYVFSNNGRFGNITGTFYTMKDSQERPYEYTTFFTTEKFGLTRNVVKEDLDGDGIQSLWYEYNTQATLNAGKGTVPLVIMLHGNGNDPRAQIETSGWAEVASKNNIMLVEPEWQGSTIGGYAYDPMTGDDSSSDENDIITLVNKLKEKYPQIDSSRIYVEGLSRGSRNSLHIGLVHPEVFAGLGVHSGGINAEFVDGLKDYVDKNADQYDMPVYMVIGTKDVFNYLPCGTNTGGASIQVALQYYQRFNDLPVTTEFSGEEYYGVQLENYHSVDNAGSLVIKSGTLTNAKGVSISLNAIENFGHWNYEPTANEMWNFFKQYSRNTSTGEIVVEGNNEEKVPETDEKTQSDQTTESVKSVKTGDDTNILSWGLLTLLTVAAYVYLKKEEIL